jgi:hypothetical protein
MPMNRVYRIYTEDADRDAVVRAVTEKFESFTLHLTDGYYKGRPEKSIVIEIVDAQERDIKKVAQAIQAILGQKSVLVMTLQGRARKLKQRSRSGRGRSTITNPSPILGQ